MLTTITCWKSGSNRWHTIHAKAVATAGTRYNTHDARAVETAATTKILAHCAKAVATAEAS